MSQASETAVSAHSAGSASPLQVPGFGPAMEQATLGATVVVKGELSGSQSLYIDGRVEGSIHFSNHRVTVGRSAVVLADIQAKEVVIMGTVTGKIDCSDRVDIRSDAVLYGDVSTQRISIDSGALVKGNVEVRKAQPWEPEEEKVGLAIEAAGKESEGREPGSAFVSASAQTHAAEASTTESGSGHGSTFRVSGSKVLYHEHKAGSR